MLSVSIEMFVMKKCTFLLCTVSSCCLTFSALAQFQPAKDPASIGLRYWVGVDALRSHYEVFFPLTPNDTGTGAWQVSMGVNITPRLATQAGISYTHDENIQDPEYSGTTLSGQYTDGSRINKRWTYCLPILARYAVVRYPHPRLQVDAILGLTLLGTRYLLAGENRVDGQVVSSFFEEGKATHLYATGGVGLRYPFGRHFEGVFDWTYSKNFRSAPDYVHLAVTGNKLGLTKALSLGLRYRFAVQKKTAATAGQ